jgi:hypothetical protein
MTWTYVENAQTFTAVTLDGDGNVIDGGPGTTLVQQSTQVFGDVTEAAAYGSAEGRLAAAAVTVVGGNSFSASSVMSGTPDSDPPDFGADLNTFSCSLTAQIYRNLACSVDYFAFATGGETAPDVFDDFGVGLLQDHWNKVETKAFTTTGHSYEYATGTNLGNLFVPPQAPLDAPHLFQVQSPYSIGISSYTVTFLAAVVKWTF